MAALIQRELGIEADLVEGDRREFTVWVGETRVAGKGWLGFPSDERVLLKVRARLGRGS